MYLKVYIDVGRYRMFSIDEIEYFSTNGKITLEYVGIKSADKIGLKTTGVADGWALITYDGCSDPNLQLQLVEKPELGKKYCFATVWKNGSMKNVAFKEGYLVNDKGDTLEIIK